MFCSKCGNEIAEGSAFCGKCGAPVGAQAGGVTPAGSAQGAATGGAGAGAPAPKRSGAKIGVIAAVAVVAVVLVAGFATNGFGLAGVQPKEAVEVPAASQGADGQEGANAVDGQGADVGENAGDAQGDVQDAAGAAVKSAVEAYTWDELSQISAEIGAAGDEAAAIEVAKKYNLCTPEGKLDGTQVKSVTLADGTQTTVQIVGFAHDDKTAGGKAGITFIFGDCIAEAPMNSSSTNAGGWEASQMRASLNGEGLSLLPSDLAAAVVPVDKLTNNVGETDSVSSVSTTSDKLWLFSYAELAGPIRSEQLGVGSSYEKYAAVFNAEGSPYMLFEDVRESDPENTILIKNMSGQPQYWPERSPDPRESGSFQLVTDHGRPRDYGAGADYVDGVVPGFCI
ncbi:DUF6273 domain-containing protein [Adlercreutzia sp. R7]|uniref:DUF6273 domain-containing protein n=1 Tax=Adlercreutzia wanghongyangiae TaxID=3111451 RepID=A0ABU6IJI6_9ACTN|nr:DUF6273 domain-containing protein [Adlercreutzia sp. R7]